MKKRLLKKLSNFESRSMQGQLPIVWKKAKEHYKKREAFWECYQRCLELGLVNKVVSPDVLLDEALSWAERLSLRSSQSLKLTKQIMRKSLDSTYEDIYGLEAKTQNTLTGSEDNIEGITAFMEKRQPQFK